MTLIFDRVCLGACLISQLSGCLDVQGQLGTGSVKSTPKVEGVTLSEEPKSIVTNPSKI